jgi:hypothetical protein
MAAGVRTVMLLLLGVVSVAGGGLAEQTGSLRGTAGAALQRGSCADGNSTVRLQALQHSFEQEGIMISVLSSASIRLPSPSETSATTIRNDLPFTMYMGNIDRYSFPYDSFLHGIVFQPSGCASTPKVSCAYTNDAFTSDRPTRCGPSPTYPDTSGACGFSGPDEYTAFYLKPPAQDSVHLYGKGLCYFSSLDSALESQVAFYSGMASSTTFPLPGPPLYDEVIVGHYTSEGLLGVFWAHPGPFMDDPAKVKAQGGCLTKSMLAQINYTLPVFEFANVEAWTKHNVDYPTVYRETLAAMVARNNTGGHQASEVIRSMDMSMYNSSLFDDCCPPHC